MRPLSIHSALILQWRMPRPPVMLFVCPIYKNAVHDARGTGMGMGMGMGMGIGMGIGIGMGMGMGMGNHND